jgi:hypothetical protein
MGLYRDIFTGELKERPDCPAGREIIYIEPIYYNPTRAGSPWDRGTDHVDRGMSLQPEQATPERIARENEECRHHNTGAYYTPDGLCHMPTRGSRRREMARPHHGGLHYQDNDAGYSDAAGR